nr:hypothetical protein GCM10010200_079370 [Actinomadura rugatobispora]
MPWATRYSARSDDDGRSLVIACLDGAWKKSAQPEEYATAVARMTELGEAGSLARTVQGGVMPEGPWWLLTEGPAVTSLRDVVAAGGPLPQEDLYRVAEAVAHALTLLDEAGLVHGMLTPDCVRVDLDADLVKVEWYGLLPVLGRVEFPAGAPYLAPRNGRFQRGIGIKDDVYSFGRLLLFMLIGDDPPGLRRRALRRRLRQDPDVDDDLVRLISGCLRRWAWTRPRAEKVLTRLGRLRGLSQRSRSYMESLTPPDEPPGSETVPATSREDETPLPDEGRHAEEDEHVARAGTRPHPDVVDAHRILKEEMSGPGAADDDWQPHHKPVKPTEPAKATEAAEPAGPWVFPTNGMVDAPVTVAGGVVYAASTDGRLYALDLSSGKHRWTYATDDAVLSAPVVANGHVHVASTDGRVHSVSAETGRPVWQLDAGPIGISDPVLVAGGLHFVTAEGDIVSLWLRSRTTEITFVGDAVGSSLTAAGTDLYVGALSGLHAMTVADERLVPRWHYAHADFSGCTPAVSEHAVFVGGTGRDGGDALYAVGRAGGEEIWTRPTRGLVCGRPALGAGARWLFAADDAGGLSARDAASGAELWAVQHQGGFVSGPVVDGGTLYAGGRDRHLRAYDTGDGRPLWKAATGGWINRGGPVAAGGLVIVGSADGHVHAVTAGGDRIAVPPEQIDIRLTL